MTSHTPQQQDVERVARLEKYLKVPEEMGRWWVTVPARDIRAVLDALRTEASHTPQQQDVEQLREFARWAFQACFDGHDLDGYEVQWKGAELGLLTETPYDPERHGGSETEIEPGEPWFEFAPVLRAAPPAGEAAGAEEVERIARAIARRIAKRENGERYEGFESSHWEAAQDYARAVLANKEPRDD